MAQASPEPVRTFTVGFADDRYDERPFARAVAERYSTRHEEIVLEPDAAATLPRLAAAFDEPLGDEAALPLFLICEAARREVTVALVGDGGDESFAGYERYAAIGLAERVPAPAASAGARLLRALPVGPARAPLARLPRRALPRGGRRAAQRALRAADAGASARAARRALDGRREGGDRRAHVRRLPARPAAAARDRRAPAARPRDVPSRRPAAEVGHRVDGALARAALAAARPPRRRARAGAAGDAEVPRPRGQGRAPPRVRRRAAAAGRGPRQERLRRPARAVVPQRAPAARRRSAARRARAVARLVPRRHDRAAAGRAHRRARRPRPPSSGRSACSSSGSGRTSRRRRPRPRPSRPGDETHRLSGARVRLRGAATRDPAPRARRDHRLVHGEERHVRADVRAARDVRLPRRASRRRTRSRCTAGSSSPSTGSVGRSWESIGISQLVARRS